MEATVQRLELQVVLPTRRGAIGATVVGEQRLHTVELRHADECMTASTVLDQFEALVSLGNGGRVTYRVRLTTLLGRVSHTIEEQYGD